MINKSVCRRMWPTTNGKAGHSSISAWGLSSSAIVHLSISAASQHTRVVSACNSSLESKQTITYIASSHKKKTIQDILLFAISWPAGLAPRLVWDTSKCKLHRLPVLRGRVGSSIGRHDRHCITKNSLLCIAQPSVSGIYILNTVAKLF